MSNAPSIGPSHPDHNKPINHTKPVEPTKKFKHDSDKAPVEGFAQKAWGFNAEEAKKFISTLANTIITQIKHEDQKVKEESEKLKRAEEGQDQ